MDPAIIAAIIGFAGTIIAAVIGRIEVKKYRRQITSLEENTFVRFIRQGESLKDILPLVKSVCMYSVNSYELFNSINVTLEQNPGLSIRKMTILVRKKPDESSGDIEVLENIISQWKKWAERKRIKKLDIIAYDHDPDHYYTILGSRMVFCGQVLFDASKPTGTNVDYLPLVFNDETGLGQQVISNYQRHFDNVVEKYKDTGLLYSSSQS